MDKVFKLTNKYIILATPLILFSLISNMYLALSVHGRVINLIIAIAIILLMTGAFFAGWLNMIKTCIIEPESTMLHRELVVYFRAKRNLNFLDCLKHKYS